MNMEKIESAPTKLIQHTKNYQKVLEKLNEMGLFGNLAIYPTIGVDILIAQFVKVVGINLWYYDNKTIIENISPILPQEIISNIQSKLPENLNYISNIDISNINLFKKTIEPYHNISPKSLIIKGLFENAFLREWDIDSERFFDVTLVNAKKRASYWIENILKWLKRGDSIIAFDRQFSELIMGENGLKEIETGMKDLGEDHDFAYFRGVKIISLMHFARVFKYI